MKLLCSALFKVSLGIVLVGTLIFLPAGTLSYTEGWLLMGILFVPMLLAGFVMLFKVPKLLEKRLDAREARGSKSDGGSLRTDVYCRFCGGGT